MNGILIIDKPDGLTSHDVVARLRRILGTKKIGHTGTLDPFATGVLVMLVGKATRLARFLDKDQKSYDALVRFGFETDTGDRLGERTKEAQSDFDLSTNEIVAVVSEFTGAIEQIPPMFSAKKVKGKKLYELARKGIEIERKPVPVTVSEINVHDGGMVKGPGNTIDARMSITCSAGTYIRTLAEDIGRRLNVPCHLAELRRTGAGRFGIQDAITLEKLALVADCDRATEFLIPMAEAVSHLNLIEVSESDLKRVQNGMTLVLEIDAGDDTFVGLTDISGELIAIAEYDRVANSVQPRLVFA